MRDTGCKANILVHKYLLIIIIIPFLTFSCRAESNLTEEIIRFSGADKLTESLPESVRQNEILSDADFSLQHNGALKSIILKLFGLLADAFKRETAGFLSLCAFLAACVLLRLQSGLSPEVERVADLVCMLCICGYCHALTYETLRLVTAAVSEIDLFMTSMLPVMASLYTVGGAAATATVQNAAVYGAVTLFEKINASLLTPLFNCCFALTMVCAVSSVRLSGVVKFIKNFVIRLCVTLLTLLIAVLFFQSALSGAADSLTMRGIKYAAGFIPIVGSLVGEAARTVAASIGVIKASAGVFAVTAILYTVLAPCAVIICKKTLLAVCSVVGGIIGADREAAFIEEVDGILSILLALLLSVGIFFILAVTIFIKTAVTV